MADTMIAELAGEYGELAERTGNGDLAALVFQLRALLDVQAGQVPDLPPTELSDYQGEPYARWGRFIAGPGEESDPVPCVWASDRFGGEVEVGDMRLSLEVADALAQRIAAAVRYQSARRGAR